ncbi:MAG: chloride channel protein, partial [Anaerolineae bacterium]|nr:chloride channel protein [Anaerolineae bacterium]
LKMVATSLTLGSGGSGGIFAPLLFVGAMFGGAYGLLLQGIFPGIELAPSGAYALVGMAAAFASAAHAPMTAMLIAFEMSGSYTLILPLMLATGVGTVLSRTLRRESIYTLPLAREGVTPAPGQALDVLQNVRIDDVMTVAVVAVSLETTLADLWALVEKTRHRGYPVLDTEGRLVGIVSLGDVQGAQTRWPDWESRQVGDICTRRLVTAFPDESVSVALQRLGIHDLSRLPVVDRDDPRILLGLIHLSHIGEAYRQVMDSQHELRFAGRTLHPASSQGAGVFELAVGAGSRLVGKAIREYPWPAECWVVTLVRDGKVLAARGDTVIHRGDRLVFYAREADVNALQEGARASHDV